MKSSEKVTFSKRDQKCFEEFAVISDAITTMGNRISRALTLYSDDVELYLKKVVHSKKYWKVKLEADRLFYPFTSNDYSNVTKIVTLENAFEWCTKFRCSKKFAGKRLEYFNVLVGYYFVASDEDVHNKIYFRFDKDVKSGRPAGHLHDKEYYESLHKLWPNESIEVLDRGSEDDPAEGIQIECYKLDTRKIDQTYLIFRHKLLPKLLKELPW